MVTVRLKIAAVALGGASLVAGLAGCSADAATPAPSTAAATPSTASSAEPTTPLASGTAGAGAGVSAGTGGYKDGSYSASGSYNSPGGEESVTVKLTLQAGKVSAVTVVGNATDGNAVRYQKEFSEGISAKAVGMDIATLKVDKVAGSSLTSGGFNDAVEKIKAKANA
ncbi:MAG: FMN-binding protein [Microbacteriaceae bacterium]|nr:FMN-binding protein [Microbacteriaceae bacterium]